MKTLNLITKIIVLFFSVNSFAQGLQGIIVEKYYIPNAADISNATANSASPALTANSVTYRLYVDMNAGYKFNSLFGTTANPLTVNTTTSFYNDPSYGVTVNAGSISATNLAKNTTLIDSYFTTGGAGAGKVGVPKGEDTDGAITMTTNTMANVLSGCYGLSITGNGAQDGLLPSSSTTYLAPNVLGISTELDVLGASSGNSITITNGSIAALGGIVGPTSSNKVFIGQFTTNGVFTFALNIQIQPVGGNAQSAENYYASNAPSGGIVSPSLTLVANTPPTITLAANPSTSGIITGTTMNLTATAADVNGGTVTGVEFFVDGVSIGNGTLATGNSTSGTYTQTYVASANGSHVITAKATDNDCASTTTSNYSITVAPNTAPTATLTAAATSPYSIAGSAPNYGNVYQGAALTLSATGTDNDGTISSVEFYTNESGSFALIGSAITPQTYSGQTTPAQTQAYTIPSAYSGTLTLRVRVKDNLNLWSSYQTITMNVVGNPVPVCTLTAPTSSTSIISPNTVTLSATATDDGSVASVTFYVDNVSVGVDVSSPYSVSWTSTPGLHTFKAMATDNMSALGYSATVSVDVVDPTAPPYKVGTVSQNCDQNTYLMPVVVMPTYNVTNVIGYDMVLNYDAAMLTPTGDVIMNTNSATYTINPSYVDAVSQIMPVNGTGNTSGTINISLYLNASAPVNTFFSGQDKTICYVKFTRNGLGNVATTPISFVSLNESYYNQVVSKGADGGNAVSTKNTTYVGDLKFWFDNQAMPYTNGTNLITEVNGAIYTTGATAASGSNQLTIPTSVADVVAGMNVVANGVTYGTTVLSVATGNVITLSANTTAAITVQDGITFVSATAVTPNASGSFTHSLLNGQKIRISRDISPNQAVQSVINAADAVIAKTVVLGGNYTPSIYQMLAMDVNLDGKVSAGDVSQMKQRATSSYGEFRQAWNYSAAGVSNGQPSKDWVFVDQTTVSSDAAYQISSTFPAQTLVNGSPVGYSKNNVPVVNFNLNANVSNYSTCPIVETETYKGIMLGDANGSYATLSASQGLKSENGAVVLDLASAVKEGNTFRIPVSFESTESTNALDFAVRFNENNVSFAELNNVAVGMEASSFMNEADRTLRFTGFDVANFTVGSTVAELVLQSNNESISEKDIIADLALVNGKPVDVKFEKSSEAIQSVFNVSIYPNPSNGAFSVQATENAIVDVYDMNGKQITASQVISSNGKVNIDLNNVEAGVYLVRVQNETFSTTKRIVIEK